MAVRYHDANLLLPVVVLGDRDAAPDAEAGGSRQGIPRMKKLCSVIVGFVSIPTIHLEIL